MVVENVSVRWILCMQNKSTLYYSSVPPALLWKKWVPRRLGRSRSRRNKPRRISVITTWPGPGPELIPPLNRLGIPLRLRDLPLAHVQGFSWYGRPRWHTRHLRIQRFRVHLTPAASNHIRARIMRRTGCCWAHTQLVERNHVAFFFAIP